MKPRLSLGVCVIISLALVLLGLGIGTYGGFAEDRAKVTDLLSGENGLTAVLEYRGADGLNLCVVAERHLRSDADVLVLRQLSQTLQDGGKSLSQRREADGELGEAVNAVVTKLKQTQSYIASERDQGYVAMLQSDMQSLSQRAVASTYNTAVEEFNQKLEGTLMGKLVPLAAFEQLERHRHRRFRLFAQNGRGIVVHIDQIGGVHDRQTGNALQPLFFQNGGDLVLLSDQNDLFAKLLRGQRAAPDRAFGRVVAAHRVHDDLHVRFPLSACRSARAPARRS